MEVNNIVLLQKFSLPEGEKRGDEEKSTYGDAFLSHILNYGSHKLSYLGRFSEVNAQRSQTLDIRRE